MTWTDYEVHGFFSDVYSQLFDAAGNRLGSQQLVSNDQLVNQYGGEVAGLAGGGYVVSWIDNGALKATIFNAAGARVGSEFTVTSDSPVFEPHITGLASGGFVVAWAHDSSFAGYTFINHLRLQVFDAAGSKVGSEILVDPAGPAYFSSVDVSALPSGGFVLTWAGYDGGSVRSFV